MRSALLAGSTGLIGSQLLQLLLGGDRYVTVNALTRSDPGIEHPKLVQIKADFKKLGDYSDELKADDVFCCLGTTMAKARSREKFREVDLEFPLTLARMASAGGSGQFLIVSALGADRNSAFFYNRVKGEMEEALVRLPFQSIHIFRPSLLLGPRSESRPGEDAAKFFYKFFSFLIPAKYKGIESEKVARAMLAEAALEKHGIFFHESAALQQY